MYQFKRLRAPGFMLVESRPSAGDKHTKRFAAGTTPQNQGTFNLYLAGEFSLSIAATGFSQRLTPGQTNLDLPPGATSPGVDVVERALSDGCWRMCLSPQDKAARWTRRIVVLAAGGVLEMAAGDLAVVLEGGAESAGEVLPLGAVAYAQEAMTIASAGGARLAVARLL